MPLTLEERYLEGLRRLRKHVTVLEEMARWKEDLASRLWRSECVLRATGELLHDAKELEREVTLYREIAAKILEKKHGGG